MDRLDLWKKYQKHHCRTASVGVSLDISRMNFPPRYLSSMADTMDRAFAEMQKLESGAIANPDEQRMVGHYWLRNPELAPEPGIAEAIRNDLVKVKDFARRVHKKELIPPTAKRYTDLLLVGIGGSALGPQLVADALGAKRDKLTVHYLDNTDPDGFIKTIDPIKTRLKSTLVVVISKSGGTKETRNGMLAAKTAFEDAGLEFASQAVAVTGDGSKLDQVARDEGWLDTFPMYDWVGGRTSVMATVGLLPMALQGLDIDAFLEGAAKMDEATRQTNIKRNPAALLALMWHHATNGVGEKDMVILPYKDRLVLMSKYLQQLIMESLGKKLDLDGNEVHQGISVFGNKGSTDQHAYVQQLRDGVHNFFVTFIVVLQDYAKPTRSVEQVQVEPGVVSGDYLNAFWQGTRDALYEQGRESVTLTLDKLEPKSVGALIALYERAVGLYATLVNINAYHQPGVEAGKKAATSVLEVQAKVTDALPVPDGPDGDGLTAEQVAQRIGMAEQVETVHHVLEHLAANKRIKRSRKQYTRASTG